MTFKELILTIKMNTTQKNSFQNMTILITIMIAYLLCKEETKFKKMSITVVNSSLHRI